MCAEIAVRFVEELFQPAEREPIVPKKAVPSP
jgi:hypothetical protein